MEFIPIDSSPCQEMSISFKGKRLRLTIYYNSIADGWKMDVFDLEKKNYVAQRVALVVGVPILGRRPLDYFFGLTDTSGLELDPYAGEDLGTRCRLYIEDKAVL